MQTFWLAACASWILCAGSVPAGQGESEISKGDTVDQVLAALGDPKGVFQKGDFMTYVYDRGVVDILDERVVFVDLLSEAEARERVAALRAAQARQAAQGAERKMRNVEEGTRARARQLANDSFKKKSASERLAYWLAFQRKYPGVDVSRQINAARSKARGDSESSARQTSMQDAKTRVREIGNKLAELDRSFADSKTHWKRRQINRERAVLAQELVTLAERLIESMDQ